MQRGVANIQLPQILGRPGLTADLALGNHRYCVASIQQAPADQRKELGPGCDAVVQVETDFGSSGFRVGEFPVCSGCFSVTALLPALDLQGLSGGRSTCSGKIPGNQP
jgi:hypothetical protein